jgi:hypothetical protein
MQDIVPIAKEHYPMKKLFYFCLFLLIPTICQAQDKDELMYAASCSLSIKTKVYPAESYDATGKAQVIAFVCDKEGNPMPIQKVEITATAGTVVCQIPGFSNANWLNSTSSLSDQSCFVTGQDGRVTAYVTDIPFNQAVGIRANCTCNNFNLSATGKVMLTRKITQKKKTKIIKK